MLAVLAVWRFYRQLKSELANHKPMAKFLAFKLVVMLTFLQAVSAQLRQKAKNPDARRRESMRQSNLN